MANKSSPDYKKLFLQAEEQRIRAEEQQKQAEKQQKQAEKWQKQAEERQKQAEDDGKRDRERSRQTTFTEFVRYCHNLLSRSLSVETPSRSTTGSIPPPTGKYCPTQLKLWTDFAAWQQEIFDSVSNYLQPAEEARSRLFTPLLALEEHARRFSLRPISSEQGIETYERIAVEDHVRDIVAELCKIDAARNEFGLGDGILFDNHTNSLGPAEEGNAAQSSNIHHPRPDQFCIHRIDGDTSSLLTTVEYKPPHKLSMGSLRAGLRQMDLWKHMVKSNKIPTGHEEKMKYHAERLVCSAIVQEYHVMIQEGLEYSYVTNGIARVLLRVRSDDPGTLYYFLCDPNREVDGEIEHRLQEPKTSVARVLCLCLMAFRSPVRDQEWRNAAQSRLPLWTTSFDHTRSLIPKAELQQIAPHSDSTISEYVSPGSSSDYQPSSPPPESPTGEGRRVPTRSQASCAPSDVPHRTQSPESSGSDANDLTGRKRGFSQITSSPSAQRATRQREARNIQSRQSTRRDAQFCTQRCLLGLQTGGILDESCPNVKFHRRGLDVPNHPITSEDLVRLLKAQLDENIDRCVPLGGCGAYGAPFKLTCVLYGYTVVGKGTTTGLWKEVSGEAQVYQILRKAQGSAVPVFLGAIDLAKIYFLHGAGEIRHMLVMGWGGERTELEPWLRKEIHKSIKEIRALGIIHGDLRCDNILWNNELGRALIIDFHRSTLRNRPTSKRSRAAKRQLCRTQSGDPKRLRVL